jgi:DNA-binding MarR family transcriptional regulator
MPRRTNVLLDSWTAAQRVDQLVTRELKAANVWTPHYALLSMICIREPITRTALAQEMGVAPTTLSDRLQELLGLGHIRRVKNPSDGRSYLIRSTAAGRRKVESAAPVTVRTMELLARRLGRRKDAVETAIDELKQALDAQLAEPPAAEGAA